MIQIKNLTVKNFMSVGNTTQGIDFDRQDLTLVLGENLDLGGDGSRNGTGKTTIINALSYAMYGQALSNIRKDNLVNKTNAKGMMVSLDFAVNGKHTRLNVDANPMCCASMWTANNKLPPTMHKATVAKHKMPLNQCLA